MKAALWAKLVRIEDGTWTFKPTDFHTNERGECYVPICLSGARLNDGNNRDLWLHQLVPKGTSCEFSCKAKPAYCAGLGIVAWYVFEIKTLPAQAEVLCPTNIVCVSLTMEMPHD